MDVIPESNLPDISQAWGKKITGLVQDLMMANDRSNLDVLNNNKSIAGSVQKLSEQVLFTSSLRTYAVVGGGGSISSPGSAVLETLTMPTITLTRNSTLLIQYTTSVSGSSTHTAPNPNPLSRLSEYIMIDGAVQPGGGSLSSGIQIVAGTTTLNSTFEGSRVHPLIVTLAAGTHTLVAGCTAYVFGTSGSMTLNSSSFTASVIG